MNREIMKGSSHDSFDIIRKKRSCGEPNKEEIGFFIGGLVSGPISDYQASALLMAVVSGA